MYPATSWSDESTRAWTVVGRVRDRQEQARNRAVQARRRAHERATKDELPAAAAAGTERDRLWAEWRGEPTVLAFLFSLPNSAAIRALDSSIDYLDQRTGDKWDLFFPGYYRQSHDMPVYEDRPIGGGGVSEWLFNSLGFDIIRRHVETESAGRWSFSGNADLVLVGAWLTEEGEPVIDWPSTVSGTLTEPQAGTSTLTLGAVVERITNDLERSLEDPSYGVGAVVDKPDGRANSIARDVLVNALGGIAGALGGRALGP